MLACLVTLANLGKMPGLYDQAPRRDEPQRHAAAAELGPWRELPPGYTIPGTTIKPLCSHCSPVRPGSDTWTEDCDEPATHARRFGEDGIEYACTAHARGRATNDGDRRHR